MQPREHIQLQYSHRVRSREPSEKSPNPYLPPAVQDSVLGQAVPWLRNTLLLLALQIGLTVSASATAWFSVGRSMFTLVFAAIPAGAMAFSLLRRRRPLMRVFSYWLLLALAGAIGWGVTSGLFFVWLKFFSVAGARLPTLPLFMGFGILWGYYIITTLIGLWAGAVRRRDRAGA